MKRKTEYVYALSYEFFQANKNKNKIDGCIIVKRGSNSFLPSTFYHILVDQYIILFDFIIIVVSIHSFHYIYIYIYLVL